MERRKNSTCNFPNISYLRDAELMGTKVSAILKHKGHDVITVAPQQTVSWVVRVLAENRSSGSISAALVRKSDKVKLWNNLLRGYASLNRARRPEYSVASRIIPIPPDGRVSMSGSAKMTTAS
jgi:CBS domain-containing protein